MCEALPLAATALLPVLLFPLLGIAPIGAVTAPYADPLIFLFLGGFLLALALQRWGLDRRIALVALGLAGGHPRMVIAGIMIATAFLSLWISNTATAMAMLPIGQSILATMQRRTDPLGAAELERFAPALMLGIAYAATIGGMGTLIGTPPNALFAAYMLEAHGLEIGFARWMALGVPMVLVLLPVAWLVLTRIVFRVPAGSHAGLAGALRVEAAALAPMSRGERRVAALMVATALAWLLRPLIERLVPGLPLSDAGIALAAAGLLFGLRADGRALIGWREAAGINWGVLILFGGGLALAAAIDESGLAAWIGQAAGGLAGLPWIGLVVIVAVLMVGLGELASNTAMAAVFLPVAGAAAAGMGADPLALALPVALAASLGFMLPVATPPNAIVFSSRAVSVRQMLKAGAVLDGLAIAVVVALAGLLAPVVFDLG
jgi:sodium-dependent dicarboxylate transporter 2/3/5